MSNHTTFKIGGNAAVVVLPKSENEIASVIKECNRLGIRYMTVGNGSNLLVSDDGIDACVILLGKDFSDVTLIGDDTIFAQAGASLTKVCRTALENSLTGLEFAYGIPGSCGGGAFMNAGAYGGELKDVLVKCDHIDQNGEKGTLCGDGLKLSYRHSAYYDNGCTITGVYFKLKKGNPDEIKSKMQDLMGRRRASSRLNLHRQAQPLNARKDILQVRLLRSAILRAQRSAVHRSAQSMQALLSTPAARHATMCLRFVNRFLTLFIKKKAFALKWKSELQNNSIGMMIFGECL